MSSPELTTFKHPHEVYHLEYPAAWECLVEKEGESCGFGPHKRDDVGLWISILPMSVDTDKLADELPRLMQHAMRDAQAANQRRDPTLRHYGLIADMTKEGQGGHYWIVAGGDVVLFASTQVPPAEREVWNPLFQQVMASLQITRDEELLFRKLVIDVMAQLHEQMPDQEFTVEGNQIRGTQQVIYLGNLFRETRAAPARRMQIIKRFVAALRQPANAEFGHEQWDEIHQCLLPILKPRAYLKSEGPTQHMLWREWLSDVVICYAIYRKKTIRFVTGWDVGRWAKDDESLHEVAMANLAQSRWPREVHGAKMPAGGRVMVIATDDGLASSRLLHPDLYTLFSQPLGQPFWAGIPCRDTLVLFSDRRQLKQRIGRRLKKDHDASAYPITPQPFLVTRDGIAPSVDK
jgi:hypothetical protein